VKTWYWIDVGTACGGIATENGVVVDTAPYFRFLVGRTLDSIRGKQVKIEEPGFPYVDSYKDV